MTLRNMLRTLGAFRSISTNSSFKPISTNYIPRQNLFFLNHDIAQICRDYQHHDVIRLARTSLTAYINHVNPSDWTNYIQYDSRNYTKIQVIPPLSNAYSIYLLNWLPGQSSGIHGHPPGGCIMGVLSGTLEETVYPSCKPSIYNKKINILTTGNIGYINNTIGFHRIANLCSVPCNSLHIYFHNPPQ